MIDTEQGFIKLELAKDIAEAMSARYIKLDDLAADHIANAARDELPAQGLADPVIT